MDSKYVSELKKYLKNYYELKSYINSLKSEIKELQEIVDLPAVPAVSKMTATGGGGDNTSQQERIYTANERNIEKIKEKSQELVETEMVINRIDSALSVLDESDSKIIWARFIDGLTWQMTAHAGACGITLCIKKCNKILKDMAVSVYGVRSIKNEIDKHI